MNTASFEEVQQSLLYFVIVSPMIESNYEHIENEIPHHTLIAVDKVMLCAVSNLFRHLIDQYE